LGLCGWVGGSLGVCGWLGVSLGEGFGSLGYDVVVVGGGGFEVVVFLKKKIYSCSDFWWV